MTTYQYQGSGEFFPGIPARDLDERDVDRLSDQQVALLEKSEIYAEGPVSRQEPEQLDPLGELSNAEYERLTPAEKGARTRKANDQKREGDGDVDSEGDGDADSAATTTD